MFVSVIIPCYNGALFLREAIESALAQTYPFVEVIVVDDASTDDSVAVAKSFGSRITLLQNRRNMERGWSRNRAVKASRGDLIALLDADDIWFPHKVERQVSVFRRGDVAMTHSQARYLRCRDGRQEHGPTSGSFFSRRRGDRVLIRGNRVAALTAVVRKDCFDRVGGFDCRRSVQGCEDYDLWLRLANRFCVEFQDEILGYYRHHPAQSTSDDVLILIRDARVRQRFARRFPDVLDCEENRDRRYVLYNRIEDAAWKRLEIMDYRASMRLCAFLFCVNPRLWWKPMVRSALGVLRKESQDHTVQIQEQAEATARGAGTREGFRMPPKGS